MRTKLVNVTKFKRSIGRWCMHCRTSATVTAERVYGNRMRIPVRYCVAHHREALDRLTQES